MQAKNAPHKFTHHLHQCGFTLLEVMVALTIVGIALAAAIQATTAMTQQTHNLAQRHYANWSARNRLTELRMQNTWPTLGTRRFNCAQGNYELQCEEQVSSTPNPYFRRVEIKVYTSSVLEQETPYAVTQIVAYFDQRI